MSIVDVIILAVTQGLTEFLPVSSSGHLVLVRQWFGISDIDGGALDAFLHLGTLLALLLYYRKVWVGIGRALLIKDEEGKDKRQLLIKLIVATVPAAVVGYFFQDAVETYMRGPLFLGLGFLGTAMVLLLTDMWNMRQSTISRASFIDAAIIGIAQITALVPSLSRSGVTIAAGRARGLSRKQATTFSFLMSAPIIAGAGLLSLGSLLAEHDFSTTFLLTGFLFSFASGLLAISLLMKFIEKVSFWPFAVYLLVISAAILVF